MSNPTRANVFLIEDKYAIINRKMYRLELLDDEGMAEAFNGGEALPLMTKPYEIGDFPITAIS